MNRSAVDRECKTRQYVSKHQAGDGLVKRYKIDPSLNKRMKELAKKLQAQFGYSDEHAFKVAYKEAWLNWDVVVVDGVAREIRPTKADGRVAS